MKLFRWSIPALVLCALGGMAAAQDSGTEQDADATERARLKEFFDNNPVPNSTMKRWSLPPDRRGTVCESIADIPHCEEPRQQASTQKFAFTVVCTAKDGTVIRTKELRTIPSECQ